MKLVIKYILRNIKGSKFRTFLIIISIALSTALFFASSTVGGTLVNIFVDKYKNYTGNAEIMVQMKEKSPNYMYISKDRSIDKDLEYQIGVIYGSAQYTHNQATKQQIQLNGYKLDDFKKIHTVSFHSKSRDIEPFEGNKIIVSKEAAAKYNWKIGDYIKIDANGGVGVTKQLYKVVGLANPVGFFTADTWSQDIKGVVPKTKLSFITGKIGKENTIYIKTKAGREIKQVIEDLKKQYNRYEVKEVIPQEELEKEISSVNNIFYSLLIVVVGVSIFIIYTSFKVIIIERLPVIGTLRSIGATERATNVLMLVENIFYATIGAIIGCVMGVGILYVIVLIFISTSTAGAAIDINLNYGSGNFIAAYIFSNILVIVSSIFPILGSKKFSIKEMLVNEVGNEEKVSIKKSIIGIIFLLFAIIVPKIVSSEIQIIVSVVSILLMQFSIMFVMPILVKGIIRLIGFIYKILFGVAGLLAAKNIKTNKYINDNIALITLGVTSIIAIFIVTTSFDKVITDAYRNFNFDILGYVWNGDSNTKVKMQGIQGVSNYYIQYIGDAKVIVNDKNEKPLSVSGVELETYLQYDKLEIVGDKDKILETFNNSRHVLIDTRLRDNLKLDINDKVDLEFNNKVVTYKIIGFAKVLESGFGAYIPEKFMKMDGGKLKRLRMFVKVNNQEKTEEVKKLISNRFKDNGAYVETLEKAKEMDKSSMQGISVILGGFVVFSVIIGIFGILNNFMISFITRKKVLGVLRSIGMSKLQIVKMLVVESLSIALLGGVIGCFMGVVLTELLKLLSAAANMMLPIYYGKEVFIQTLIWSVIISLIASISSMLRAFKLSIVDVIKYE